MSDANAVKNNTKEGHYVNQIIDDDKYPEVSASIVRFLGDEVQIEQGFDFEEEIDLSLGSGNSILSISKAQALTLAHFIIDNLEGK